jgi:hypothetical protein
VLRFDGRWSAPDELETGSIQGVALALDESETLHLFDWISESLFLPWGTVRHRSLASGDTWTAPEALDGSGRACCVAADADGATHAVWERQEDNGSTAVWRRFEHGAWSGELDLGVPPGEEARSPTVEVLPGGDLLFAWSSRAGHGTGVRVRRVGGLPSSALWN